MGIYFNYQKERNQNWRYIVIAMFFTFLLTIYTIGFLESFYKYLTDDQMQSIFTEYLDSVEALLSLLISVTFSLLLNCIYMRFEKLNNHLRNTFLRQNDWIVSRSKWRKAMLIKCIKFVARQHLGLIDVTEQLNVCYSIQVEPPFSTAFSKTKSIKTCHVFIDFR